MRWKFNIFLLAACLLTPACGSQRASKQSSDAQLFLRAVALSYDGGHNEARRLFEQYRQGHPNDLLVPMRVGYDHLFDVHAAKMSKEEYRDLLGKEDAAIALFEKKQIENRPCGGTDLAGIAGDALDCDSVGAALYSFRAVFASRTKARSGRS